MNYRAILFAAAQAVIFFISGFFIPLLGLVLTPVPLVVASLRTGWTEGVVAGALAAILIGFLAGWQFAVTFLICFGVMAAAVSEGMRRHWKPESVAVLGGLAPVALLGMLAARFFMRTGKSPVPFLEDVIRKQRDVAVKLYKDMSLTDVANTVAAVPDQFIHYFVLLIPGIVITSMLFAAMICMLISLRLILRKPGAVSLRPISLIHWHAPDVWVWGLILALGLILVPREAFQFAGWNLAIVYSAVYLLQGIAVVDHYLRKARIQPFMRGLILAIILALPSVVCVIAAGVVDIWADFRKLRGPKETTP